MVNDKTVAEAEAEDYEKIVPKEKICKYDTLCHILLALGLSAIVIGIVTLGIVIFS